MVQAALWTPLTLPFGLLPVIPNFPFLILAWRCYSHYKAWKGAEWMLQLVNSGKLQIQQDDELSRVLKLTSTNESQEASGSDKDQTINHDSENATLAAKPLVSSNSSPSEPNAKLDYPLLTSDNLAHLSDTFKLGSTEVVDLTRAVMQMNDRAKKEALKASK